MFTGIISKVAKIETAKKHDGTLVLAIHLPATWELKKGDSVAVNGTCLTVTEVGKTTWKAVLMEETLLKTSFGKTVPESVNLELPLSAQSRIDGHIVQGHVDTRGKIASLQKNTMVINYPKEFSNLIVSRGSVAVDGISLTIAAVGEGTFSVALIPFTIEHTTLGSKKSGDFVNIEFDIIAKYAMKER